VLHECQDFLVLDKEGLKEEARKPLLSEALKCSNLAAMLIQSDLKTIPTDNLLLPRPFPTVTLLPPTSDVLSFFFISIIPCFSLFFFMNYNSSSLLLVESKPLRIPIFA
jgi:hypothetical protein